MFFSTFRLYVNLVVPGVNLIVVGFLCARSVVAVIAHLEVEGIVTASKNFQFAHGWLLGVEGLLGIAHGHFAHQHVVVGGSSFYFDTNHGHSGVGSDAKVGHFSGEGVPLSCLLCIGYGHFLVLVGFAFQCNEQLGVGFVALSELVGDAKRIVGRYVEHGFEQLNVRSRRLSVQAKARTAEVSLVESEVGLNQ